MEEVEASRESSGSVGGAGAHDARIAVVVGRTYVTICRISRQSPHRPTERRLSTLPDGPISIL